MIYASKVAAWLGALFLAFALAACGDRPASDPCPAGCKVPAGPAYVPLCEPSDQGPCVEATRGAWYVRHSGARTRVAPCPTEAGGPVPCVWVPSAMGNDQGDSGAYLYGTGVRGFPFPSEVEPS